MDLTRNVHSHVLPYKIVKKGLPNKRSGQQLHEIECKYTTKKATLQEARLLSAKPRHNRDITAA